MNCKKATRRFASVLGLSALGRVVAVSVFAVIAAGAVTGCAPEPMPFDPVAMQRPFRERAVENATPGLPPIPLTLDRTFLVKREGNADANRPAPLPTTAQSVGPAIRIPLRDLIQLAAINSLQVRVTNYQAAVEAARVVEAEARFDPVFVSSINFSNQTLLSPTPQAPQTGTQFQTTQLQFGLRQQLETGAQVQLQYTATQTFRTQPGQEGTFPNFRETNNFADPIYESGLQLQVTQPLLQNAGAEVNRARIVVARNTQRVSLLDARLQLERTVAEIEQLYWQLVQAERELQIQERLYQDTVNTAIILQQRAGQDVTRVQLGQTNAALRGREANLIAARYQLRRISHEIKRRVNDPNLPVSSAAVILPDDQPLATPIRFDLAEQIESALSNRAELAQQQIRIDSATVVYNAARNNLLPSLNLVGSIGVRGADIGQFGGSLRAAFEDFDVRDYSIGLQLEVPLGNREPRAIFARTNLQRHQAILQYKDLIEQVTQEVKDAHDQVYSAWEQMGASRQARLAAEDALDAINQEQTVGAVAPTPDFVNRKLNAQEVLAQAARAEAGAITDYNTAIAVLERAKGTILKYDNIVMQPEPSITGGAGRVSRKVD
jgi:outer membrane protein TolC